MKQWGGVTGTQREARKRKKSTKETKGKKSRNLKTTRSEHAQNQRRQQQPRRPLRGDAERDSARRKRYSKSENRRIGKAIKWRKPSSSPSSASTASGDRDRLRFWSFKSRLVPKHKERATAFRFKVDRKYRKTKCAAVPIDGERPRKRAKMNKTDAAISTAAARPLSVVAVETTKKAKKRSANRKRIDEDDDDEESTRRHRRRRRHSLSSPLFTLGIWPNSTRGTARNTPSLPTNTPRTPRRTPPAPETPS
jgi:hypothetical protein